VKVGVATFPEFKAMKSSYLLGPFWDLHCVAKVYTVLPVSTVKCWRAGMREGGKPISLAF
jgi:hypothetical protein